MIDVHFGANRTGRTAGGDPNRKRGDTEPTEMQTTERQSSCLAHAAMRTPIRVIYVYKSLTMRGITRVSEWGREGT